MVAMDEDVAVVVKGNIAGCSCWSMKVYIVWIGCCCGDDSKCCTEGGGDRDAGEEDGEEAEDEDEMELQDKVGEG